MEVVDTNSCGFFLNGWIRSPDGRIVLICCDVAVCRAPEPTSQHGALFASCPWERLQEARTQNQSRQSSSLLRMREGWLIYNDGHGA